MTTMTEAEFNKHLCVKYLGWKEGTWNTQPRNLFAEENLHLLMRVVGAVTKQTEHDFSIFIRSETVVLVHLYGEVGTGRFVGDVPLALRAALAKVEGVEVKE